MFLKLKFENCCLKRKIRQCTFTLLRLLKGLGERNEVADVTISGYIFFFLLFPLCLRSGITWYFILVVLLWQEEF